MVNYTIGSVVVNNAPPVIYTKVPIISIGGKVVLIYLWFLLCFFLVTKEKDAKWHAWPMADGKTINIIKTMRAVLYCSVGLVLIYVGFMYL